jgi:MFS family permease
MSESGRRAVAVLALAQALSASGMMTMTLLGGILGSQLAPSPALATLPVSCTILGLAFATLPAALIMQKIGRRRAFISSALLAAVAAGVIALAIMQQSFGLLCGAALVLGTNLAFQLQHRFAAAECVSPHRVSQAVSMVMVGTLVAAAIGPQIALALKDVVPGHEYAGSFLGVAALCIATALTLTAYRAPSTSLAHAASGVARPLGRILAQPAYVTAVLAGIVSYAAMSFIMTATPISMHVHDHHSDAATAWVIQSHLLAMYAPSLFSGRLIARIGTRTGMTAGLVLMLVCVLVDVSGHDLMHYWWGLVTLGVGWNLMFLSGTALLTTTYQPAERFRAQAVNEFAVFGSQAAASLLAGPAIAVLGWQTLNLAALVPLAALVLALLVPLAQRSKNSRA